MLLLQKLLLLVEVELYKSEELYIYITQISNRY